MLQYSEKFYNFYKNNEKKKAIPFIPYTIDQPPLRNEGLFHGSPHFPISFKNIKINSAPGTDGIPNSFYKTYATQFIPVFRVIVVDTQTTHSDRQLDHRQGWTLNEQHVPEEQPTRYKGRYC